MQKLKIGGEGLKKCSICITVLCLLVLASSAWSADSGDSLFKAKCGACHVKGGEAPPVNPGDKAASIWDKYFRRGRHPVEMKISEDELVVVVKYLMNRAADSDQPEMLAIPK